MREILIAHSNGAKLGDYFGSSKERRSDSAQDIVAVAHKL